MQVASPSRERVEQYRTLRDEVEVTVGRINGEYGAVGSAPVHYLHQSYPPEEMAALYLAADVMLVTPLRDGMNLVAKEYVACRYDETGALVLSEFTGAADELGSAFLVNPHDIAGLKDAIVRAAHGSPRPSRAAGCARCAGGSASTTSPAGRTASCSRSTTGMPTRPDPPQPVVVVSLQLWPPSEVRSTCTLADAILLATAAGSDGDLGQPVLGVDERQRVHRAGQAGRVDGRSGRFRC